MQDRHESNYKGHDIIIQLTEDTKREWSYIIRIDGQPVESESQEKFANRETSIRSALQVSHHCIDNPFRNEIDPFVRRA